MDCEVEMHFTAKSVRLLVEDVAARLYASRAREKSIYDFMRDAARFGAKFYACSMSAREHLAQEEKLIAEVSGMAGAAAFIDRVLDPAWATAIY